MFKTELLGGKIKPAGYIMTYTQEQMYSELPRCIADPIYFIENYCWIISTKGRMLFKLYDFQRRLIHHYSTYERTVALLSRQIGKPIFVDTPIMTPAGFKTMGELNVGDCVFGDDGKPTTILYATEPMYGHKCYKITFDTDEIIADAEHLWMVASAITNHKPVKVTTEEILILLDKAGRENQSVYVPKLKRKRISNIKNTRHYILSITEVPSVPVRCIRVDNNSHLFLAGKSLIPTHNTETSVAFLLWWAVFKPDQKILIASYKADFAKAIMKRLKFMYEELPWWLKPGVKSQGGWNVFHIEFENGSEIIAETTTENTGRGYPANLFYLDEFAYVNPSIAEGFWTSIFPTISSDPSCRCIITSTANTDEDKFSQIWFNSRQSAFSGDLSLTKRIKPEDSEDPDYSTYWEDETIRNEIEEQNQKEDVIHGFWGFHVPWTEAPGRDENFKQNTLASGYTETEWRRDYECQFLTRNETLISPPKLLALNGVVRPPRFVDRWGMRWYEEIKPSTSYGVMLDPSEGVERDDSVIQVWEFPSMLQVGEWNSNQAEQSEQSKMLYRTIRRIHKIQQSDPDHNGRSTIYYSVECNGIGLGILNALEIEYEHQIPGWLIDSAGNKLRGIRLTSANKKNRCLDFAALIERNIFTPRSRHLVSQLKTFVQRRVGVYAAKEGSKDDIVMACVLMMQLVEELRVSDYDIQDRLIFAVTEDYNTEDAEEMYGSQYKPFCLIG